MNTEAQDTHQKVLQVNLDTSLYGTFAEIGAGQEVARWFLRVGGVSGTVAKTVLHITIIKAPHVWPMTA